LTVRAMFSWEHAPQDCNESAVAISAVMIEITCEISDRLINLGLNLRNSPRSLRKIASLGSA
jgi:hypothetical protein